MVEPARIFQVCVILFHIFATFAKVKERVWTFLDELEVVGNAHIIMKSDAMKSLQKIDVETMDEAGRKRLISQVVSILFIRDEASKKQLISQIVSESFPTDEAGKEQLISQILSEFFSKNTASKERLLSQTMSDTTDEAGKEQFISKILSKFFSKNKASKEQFISQTISDAISYAVGKEVLIMSQILSEYILSISDTQNRYPVSSWIRAYIKRSRNSKSMNELYEMLKKCHETGFFTTRPKFSTKRPEKSTMVNICKMISNKININSYYSGSFFEITGGEIEEHPEFDLDDRQLYGCPFLELQEIDTITTFQITLMPIYTLPHCHPTDDYFLLFGLSGDYSVLDYVRVRGMSNKLLVGYQLIDPTYPVEPSVVEL